MIEPTESENLEEIDRFCDNSVDTLVVFPSAAATATATAASASSVAVTDTISGDQMGGVSKIPRMWIMELTELAPREEAQDSPLSFTDENASDRNRSVG